MIFLPLDMQQELDAEMQRQAEEAQMYNQAFGGQPTQGGQGNQPSSSYYDQQQPADYGAGTDAMLASMQANNEMSKAAGQGQSTGWENQLGQMGGQMANKVMGGKGGIVQSAMGEMPKGIFGKVGEWTGATGKWATDPSTGKAVELVANPNMDAAASWWKQPGQAARGYFDQGMNFVNGAKELPGMAQGVFEDNILAPTVSGLGSIGSGLGAAGSAIGSGLGAAGSAMGSAAAGGASAAAGGAEAIVSALTSLLALL